MPMKGLRRPPGQRRTTERRGNVGAEGRKKFDRGLKRDQSDREPLRSSQRLAGTAPCKNQGNAGISLRMNSRIAHTRRERGPLVPCGHSFPTLVVLASRCLRCLDLHGASPEPGPIHAQRREHDRR
jgi:hypothetical protein